jgi:HEAT repeat protein
MMRFLGLFGRPNIYELKQKGDIEELTDALNFQEDENVRFEAAAALGDVGDSSCVESLVAALEDTRRVKEVAIRSLGQIGDSSAVPILLDLLDDPNWEIRSMAAKSLGEIGDPRATKNLIEVLDCESESLRWYIVQALVNITGQDFNSDVTEWRGWYQKNQKKG